MDKSDDRQLRESLLRVRLTTYGQSSEEYYRIEQTIQQLLKEKTFGVVSLMSAIQKCPPIRDQTSLLSAIFGQRGLVQDLISFLLMPRKMAQKYQLTTIETKKYISLILSLMRDNQQFFEFYFLSLEQNSQPVDFQPEARSSSTCQRRIFDKEVANLQTWFQFLDDISASKEQFLTSLGYFADTFIPFCKFYFSQFSNVCDYYENKYGCTEGQIWLITHFHSNLVENILRHTYHEPIFRCIFTLIRVSLDEGEWNISLVLLSKLCRSAVNDGVMSDVHIEYIYTMVKEVKENISKDKNGTVFAFLEGITRSCLVSASIARLKELADPAIWFDNADEVIDINVQFLCEIVHIHYILLEKGISKTTKTVEQLHGEVLTIRNNFAILLKLMGINNNSCINFSNGEILKTTPMFKFNLLRMVRYWLCYIRDFGEGEQELRLDDYFPAFLEMIQETLAQNRWNSIMHCQIQKIIGLIITSDFFKTKQKCLNKFLNFFIEAFTNKKFVFLHSTRIISQGDIRSLYYICCKITKAYEGACKTIGINNEYEQWGDFVVHVLQKYENNANKLTSQTEILSPSITPLAPNIPIVQFGSLDGFFTNNEGYIDEADQGEEIRRSVRNITIYQKWKNKKSMFYSSGPIKTDLGRRECDKEEPNSPKSPLFKNRGSLAGQQIASTIVKLGSMTKAKKLCSFDQIIKSQQQLIQPSRLQKIVSFDHGDSEQEKSDEIRDASSAFSQNLSDSDHQN